MTAMTQHPVPQVTFPGQAATPPGPVDLLPMYLIHHAFRRDLADFVAAVTRTPAADRTAWTALASRWRLFAGMLHAHHTGEDAILWPLLLARLEATGDQEGLATLRAMEAEHEEIDPLLSGCDDGFSRLAEAPDEDALAALQVRLVATRERLAVHLGHEESDAMALVQRHLTAAEWQELDRQFAKHYPAELARDGLPWVLARVPREAMPRVRAFLGALPILVWRLLLRRSFEQRDRVAFRHL
jgi:hypothetical protein